MLVLASASPRRRELLAQAGFSFEVHPAHIPEDPNPNEDPIAYVTRLAREKAQAVYLLLSANSEPDNPQILRAPSILRSSQNGWENTNPHSASTPALYQGTTSVVPKTRIEDTGALAPEKILSEFLAVLAADTTVTLDNHILGKPEDPADAARMLRLLCGRTHHVITGVALVTAQRTEVAAEVTAVKFLTLSEEEIAAYIATGEPMDKAGAYAIQGRAARWIPRIEGDYFNVVGLPIALVSTLLKTALESPRR
ncbi:MAG: Maf family protein [Terracidiphilus sp.]|jgi:septum formation protein